jgi:hypothetical protein
MHAGVNHALAYAALAVIASSRASASDIDSEWGRNAWLPSFAITSGVLVQRQSALQQSFGVDGETGARSFLRPPKYDNDVAATAFVGGALELMTPELPVPTGPRLFVTGEILPSFGPERQVQDDEPSRIRGPELNTVPAVEEDNTHFTNVPGRPRRQPFSEDEVKGDGMRTRWEVKQMVYSAKAGVAFGFDLLGRELRIKPSVGWINFAVEAKGLLVHADCDPVTQCTNTYTSAGVLFSPGFVRESILSAQDGDVFNGFGPGVDLEMDTGRLGPLSTALFMGLAGYYIPGDRDIDFNAVKTFDDQLSPSPEVDVNSAIFHVRIDPWLWRAGIGMRFHWIGFVD